MGPVVALIGLELSGSAASNAGLLDEVLDPRKTIVFVLTLGTAVFGSILFRKFFPRLSLSLIAVIVGYASALAAGIVDFAEVAAAPVLPCLISARLSFNLEAIMIILPVPWSSPLSTSDTRWSPARLWEGSVKGSGSSPFPVRR